jgi:hypothetical protein
MFRRNAKYAFDRLQISNGNLDVGFRIEARFGVDGPALGENASHRIDGRQRLGLQDTMQATNDSTIKIATKSVRTVPGKLDTANRGTCRQTVVRDLDPLNAHGRCQVEAQPEFNHRTDNERLADVTALPGGRFPRKIEAPLRIRLPEINSGTKPIVVVATRAKRPSQKYSLSDLTVAAVIAKNENRSEAVQELSVVSGDAARFGVDALRHEGLHRNRTRSCCVRREGLGSFAKTVQRLAAADIINACRTVLVPNLSLHVFQYTRSQRSVFVRWLVEDFDRAISLGQISASAERATSPPRPSPRSAHRS